MNITNVSEHSITAFDLSGTRHEFKADTIILAVGYKANNKLYESLKGKFPEVYNIGDSKTPRRVTEAIYEAWYIAQQI